MLLVSDSGLSLVSHPSLSSALGCDELVLLSSDSGWSLNSHPSLSSDLDGDELVLLV